MRWFLVFYHFPPSYYNGARRAYLFARSLAENNPSDQLLVFVSPESYLADSLTNYIATPKNITIHKIDSRTRVMNNFFWAKAAFFTIRKYDINSTDIIITMSKPYMVHLAGYLSKKQYGCKWVADFRELLADHRDFQNKGISRFWRILESIIIRNADIVTAVTPGMAKHFTEKYHRNVSCLLNGINEENVYAQSSALGEANSIIRSKAELNILYSGSLEGERSELFKKLLLIFDVFGQLDRKKLIIEYWGEHKNLADEYF